MFSHPVGCGYSINNPVDDLGSDSDISGHSGLGDFRISPKHRHTDLGGVHIADFVVHNYPLKIFIVVKLNVFQCQINLINAFKSNVNIFFDFK